MIEIMGAVIIILIGLIGHLYRKYMTYNNYVQKCKTKIEDEIKMINCWIKEIEEATNSEKKEMLNDYRKILAQLIGLYNKFYPHPRP